MFSSVHATSVQTTALATALVLLSVGACDPRVETFRENDRHYSVFGILDASADTQTIRVERLRDGRLYGAPSSVDAEVLLTNLSTGETVALRDSFVQFSTGASAHNFYTTTDITPSTPYQLEVRGPNGALNRASWRLFGSDNQELHAAIGRYRQTVVGLSDERDFGSAFTAWVPVPLDQGRPAA